VDLTMHGQAAVVGVGESEYTKAGASPYSAVQLASIAIRNAVEDAGLKMSDIDGLVTFMDSTIIRAADLASWLGFGNLRFCANPMSGGGNLGAAALNLADAAVCSGYAEHVVVYRSLNQGRQGRFGQARTTADATGDNTYLSPFGAAAPVVRNALLVKKFMHQYGISQDALAEISLAAYAHAQRNPRAVMYGRPLTRDAYHASRWIAEPFHLFDCCQENDGACAVVVTSSDRAQDLPQPPAYILAGANGMQPRGSLWAFNDSAFPRGRMQTIADQLWQRAGVKPEEIDVAQFYENFTGTTLIAIADIGFCPPEGLEEFVGNGNLQWPDGRLPLNTSGGNLAEAYIHGFQLVNEAVRQIRGQSTCQVDNVELSLSVAGPGTPPSSAVLFSRSRP
jgi:acetyl-CoA acetyltransferase